jgi:hypothetical protein
LVASAAIITTLKETGMKLGLLTLISIAVLLPIPAQAKTDPPPLPERSPKRAAQPPKRLQPSEVPTDPWSDAEVAAAKAKCTETLSGVRLDFEPLPPFKQGQCGTAAPILLRSVGSDTKVEIDPPATVTCELAKALSTWIFDEVQPEAMALLDSPVVKLRASSYACRNCYNRLNAHLSEHALANAFDLSEFVLASGEHITIRDDWDSRSIALPLRNPLHVMNVSASPQTVAAPLPRKSQFVRDAHQSACQIFGTVLGPAANRAHEDHFHLDMKQRRASLCQ